jgi:hypothetical protein
VDVKTIISSLAKEAADNARLAYEADVKRRPTYHDGTPRRSWDQLCDIAKRSWQRAPRMAGIDLESSGS